MATMIILEISIFLDPNWAVLVPAKPCRNVQKLASLKNVQMLLFLIFTHIVGLVLFRSHAIFSQLSLPTFFLYVEMGPRIFTFQSPKNRIVEFFA